MLSLKQIFFLVVVFFCLKIFFAFTNSVGPDEMGSSLFVELSF